MQQHRKKLILFAALAITAAPFAAQAAKQTAKKLAVEPVYVEKIKGSKLLRITFTKDAMRRSGVEITKVMVTKVMAKDASGQSMTKTTMTVPYASVIYDENGKTWVYAYPKPRTFLRTEIVVDEINGDIAILKKGPPEGTAIVTVGAQIVYGAEAGMGR